MKKDAYYFSHDSNSKDDPKCVLLIEQLGLEGYGIFWVLVETLRDQPDYKYPIILLSAIARRFNTSTEKIKAVVQNYGLFVIENDEFFYSESLVERMKMLEDNRIKRSIAGKAGNEKRWNAIAKVSQCDPNASLVEESRVDKSKEKDTIKTWKTDFETYKANLNKSYKEILTPEYISERESFHPNLDIKKTIYKACLDFWATEKGWKNKRGKRTVDIDWKATFNHSLTDKVNQVWKPRNNELQNNIQVKNSASSKILK